MFKTFKKNMWTCGFFVSLNRFKFFVNFNIYSTKKDQCVQNIQKLKIHTPF